MSAKSIICSFFLKNKCTKGAHCTFSHDAEDSTESAVICPYFQQGACIFGEKCKNRHDLDQGTEAKPNAGPFKRPSCKYFSKGECRNGKDCPYLHSGDVNKVGSQFMKDKQSGACERESSCAFQHEDKTAANSHNSGVPSRKSSNSPAYLAASSSKLTPSRYSSAKNSLSLKSASIPHSPSSGTRTPVSSSGRRSNADISTSMSQDVSEATGSALHCNLQNAAKGPAPKSATPSEPDLEINAGWISLSSRTDSSQAVPSTSSTLGRAQTSNNIDQNPSQEFTAPDYAPEWAAFHPYQDSNNAVLPPQSHMLHPAHMMPPWSYLPYPIMYQIPNSSAASNTLLSPLSLSSSLGSSFTSSSTPALTQNADAPFCQHYAMGGCQLGTFCRFRHFLTEEELKKINGAFMPQKQTEIETLADTFLSEKNVSTSTATRKVKVKCCFWGARGCRNGDDCPYLHEGHPATGNGPDRAEGKAIAGSAPQQDQCTPSSRPCWYYAEGRCAKGDRCTFSHDSILADSSNQVECGKGEHGKEENGLATDNSGWEQAPQGQGDDDPWGVTSSEQTSSKQDDYGWSVVVDSWNTPWSSSSTTESTNQKNGNGNNKSSYKGEDSARRDNTFNPSSLNTPTPRNGRDRRTWRERDGNDKLRENRRPSDRSRDIKEKLASSWASTTASKFTTRNNELRGSPDNFEPAYTPEYDHKSELTSPHDGMHELVPTPLEPAEHEQDLNDAFGQRGGEESKHSSERPYDLPDPNSLHTATADACEPSSPCEIGLNGDLITATDWASDALDRQADDADVSKTMHKPELEDQGASRWDYTEDTWQGSSWSQDENPYAVDAPTKINQPCKFFGQGHCYRGNECRFLHISQDPVAEKSESEERVVDAEAEDCRESTHVFESDVHLKAEIAFSPPIERFLFNCNINFGMGASPEEIVTSFESILLVVSNIPSDVEDQEVMALVTPFGDVLHIEFDLEGPVQSARVEYGSFREAASAAHSLDNKEFRSMQLSAQLASIAPVVHNWLPSSHSRYIKLSYPTPSRVAWVYYESVSLAKKAVINLDGKDFSGRKIKITMSRPGKKQSHSFSTRVENLPPDAGQPAIQEFCEGCTLVQMVATSYTDSPSDDFERILHEYGDIENITLLPFEKTASRAIALACFTKETSAVEAVRALNNTTHRFLGDGTLNVQEVFYTHRQLSPRKFGSVREELERVQKTVETTDVQLFYNSDAEGGADDTQDINIHVFGSDVMNVARAQKALETLLHGEILFCDSGMPLWDEYFDNPSSNRAFDQKVNRDQNFFVERDFRCRHVLLFGNQSSRLLAKDSVLRLLDIVEQQRHIIDLSDICMGDILDGGLQSLEACGLGPNKVTLDLVSRAFIVRGDGNVREEVWQIVQRCRSLPSDAGADVCKLCSLSASNPIILHECGHRYCTRCLQHYVRTMIGPSFAPIQCIAYSGDGEDNQCSTQLPFSMIQSLLSGTELEDLLELSFLFYVQARPLEFRLCPTPHCQMVFRPGAPGTVLRCPSCSAWICSSCCVQLHEGLTCDRYSSI